MSALDTFAWRVPTEVEAHSIPWPYSLVADCVRRLGGELLLGPWERRVIDGPLHNDTVVYVFPVWRE